VSLGERVNQLREAKKMSRAAVAHAAGVSYAFIQQLETGVRKDPGVKNLAAVASVLGVSVDDLLADNPPPGAADQPPSSKSPRSRSGRSSRPARTPARDEIDAILERLSPDDLVAVRDLLRLWASRTERPARQPASRR
jgi:transcriptional regulator with XRE-family HTH domain